MVKKIKWYRDNDKRRATLKDSAGYDVHYVITKRLYGYKIGSFHEFVYFKVSHRTLPETRTLKEAKEQVTKFHKWLLNNP